MRFLLATLVLLLFAAQASAVAADAPKPTGDLAALQGEWVVDHAEDFVKLVLGRLQRFDATHRRRLEHPFFPRRTAV